MHAKSVSNIVRGALATVRCPGAERDLVSAGLLKGWEITENVLRVRLGAERIHPELLGAFKRDCERALKASLETEGRNLDIRVLLQVESVCPRGDGESSRDKTGSGRLLTPLQDEVIQKERLCDPDPMVSEMLRPDLAPEAGYGEEGPDPLGGPMGTRNSTKWRGLAPVFQWEINPTDASLQYGESEVERDGWIFRMWWQVHPVRLVYASISAIVDDEMKDQPQARPHPIGRNVAVNLVYDLRRQGVVAIYGTAQDFRPFVDVFLRAFGKEKLGQAGGKATPRQAE